MNRHIVVVEDEELIARNYCDAFRRHGFRVSHFRDRKQAMQGMEHHLPDLAIIDVGLGHEPEGGFDLCRDLRSRAPSLPIIFLTARDNDFDVISGLRLGADDYLTKDISQAHMMARVIALFRRIDALTAGVENEQIVQRGPLTLNMDRMQAWWQDQSIDLTMTELWIVYALARHVGQVRNRQQLMDVANVVLDDSTITSHIKRIRRKIKAIDPGFNGIQTAYGLGYRWVPA